MAKAKWVKYKQCELERLYLQPKGTTEQVIITIRKHKRSSWEVFAQFGDEFREPFWSVVFDGLPDISQAKKTAIETLSIELGSIADELSNI